MVFLPVGIVRSTVCMGFFYMYCRPIDMVSAYFLRAVGCGGFAWNGRGILNIFLYVRYFFTLYIQLITVIFCFKKRLSLLL